MIVLGKVLLTGDGVVFAHVGVTGSLPWDVSVYPVHPRIQIIHSIFNLFELLQCSEYVIFTNFDFLSPTFKLTRMNLCQKEVKSSQRIFIWGPFIYDEKSLSLYFYTIFCNFGGNCW